MAGPKTYTFKDLVIFVAAFAVYFALARAGLELASINPSATPVWPPTGFAIGMALLFGYRVTPAIFAGAFFANLATAGNVSTSLAISSGNTLECLFAAYVLNRWSGGVQTFANPVGIGKFVLVSFVAASLSASVGVVSLSIAGFARWSDFIPIWLTWWVGDVAGAIIFAPLLVLWLRPPPPNTVQHPMTEILGSIAVAIGVAIVAFSPLMPDVKYRGTAAFLAIIPLMWAALRLNQRETATIAAILSSFAVWGQQAGVGPFNHPDPNESILLLLTFMASSSVSALALSAAVQTRKSAALELLANEARLREASDHQLLLLAELNHRVNNILAVIQSIVSRTMYDDLPREILSGKLLGRVHALARSHNALMESSWEGAELSELIRLEAEPYANQIEYGGPSVTLAPLAAQSFALSIHELMTNSAKYGALSVREGRVIIRWNVVPPENEAAKLEFSWIERNGPAVAPPTRTGFGTTLLKRALGQGDKEPLIDFDPLGFRFEMEVLIEPLHAIKRWAVDTNR